MLLGLLVNIYKQAHDIANSFLYLNWKWSETVWCASTVLISLNNNDFYSLVQPFLSYPNNKEHHQWKQCKYDMWKHSQVTKGHLISLSSNLFLYLISKCWCSCFVHSYFLDLPGNRKLDFCLEFLNIIWRFVSFIRDL